MNLYESLGVEVFTAGNRNPADVPCFDRPLDDECGVMAEAVLHISSAIAADSKEFQDWRSRSVRHHVAKGVIHGLKFLGGRSEQPHLAYAATHFLMALELFLDDARQRPLHPHPKVSER